MQQQRRGARLVAAGQQLQRRREVLGADHLFRQRCIQPVEPRRPRPRPAAAGAAAAAAVGLITAAGSCNLDRLQRSRLRARQEVERGTEEARQRVAEVAPQQRQLRLWDVWAEGGAQLGAGRLRGQQRRAPRVVVLFGGWEQGVRARVSPRRLMPLKLQLAGCNRQLGIKPAPGYRCTHEATPACSTSTSPCGTPSASCKLFSFLVKCSLY